MTKRRKLVETLCECKLHKNVGIFFDKEKKRHYIDKVKIGKPFHYATQNKKGPETIYTRNSVFQVCLKFFPWLAFAPAAMRAVR